MNSDDTLSDLNVENKQYQIVAVYDDHLVLMEKNAHFSDFSKRKIIEL